jgi:WD40 repeat protein
MIHWLCPQMLLVLLPEISGEERGYRHPQSTFPSLRSFLLCIALSVLGVYLAFQTLRPASILLCATSVTAETFIEAILHRPTGPSASSSLFAFQEIKFPSIAILGFTSSSHAVSFLRIMPSLQLVADLPGHTEPAWCVAWNPARSLLASCSTDRTVRLYSYSNTSSAAADPTKVSSTTTSTEPDAAFAFPGAGDAKPRVELAQVVQTEHKRTVRSVAWAPSGKAFATGSFDSSVGVWEEVDEDAEEEDEGEEGVYRPHRGCGHDHGHGHGHDQAHHHEDDEDEDGDVLMGGVVAKKEWECVTTLEGHESECKSVGWSPDGNLLASCSRDKSVWVWEGGSRISSSTSSTFCSWAMTY